MVDFVVPPSIVELLQDLTFPCTANELLKFAEERGVPEEFLTELRKMHDHMFKSMDELALTWGFIHQFHAVEEAGLAAPAPSTPDTLAPTPVAADEAGKGDSAAP